MGNRRRTRHAGRLRRVQIKLGAWDHLHAMILPVRCRLCAHMDSLLLAMSRPGFGSISFRDNVGQVFFNLIPSITFLTSSAKRSAKGVLAASDRDKGKKARSISPPSGAPLRIGAVRGSASLWLKP